jgi:hypothetical protein
MTPLIFRRLILTWWGFAIFGVAATLATERYLLPAELLNYLDSQEAVEPTAFDGVALAAGFAAALALIIGSVGLYKFRPWGKWLFLWSNVISLLISPLYGPTIQAGIASSFWHLDSLLTGGIIFSMYLPPIDQLFDSVAKDVHLDNER